jgi:hypothetical protein
MWAQSQTVRQHKLRHALTRWDVKLTVSSAWGTLHCWWCAGLCCDRLQMLCVHFRKVFYVKGLRLFIFIMPRNCLNQPDNFCYVCGELTFKSQRGNFTLLFKKCYELYFGCKLGDQEKSWALCICCVTCVRLLTGWTSGSYWMPFTVPMVWREPTDLSSDCYSCFTNITGFTSK